MRVLAVPLGASRLYLPDRFEVEAVLHALDIEGCPAVFSDAEGRERRASDLRDLEAASGVIIIQGSGTTVIRSDAAFAFAPAACACGEDALVPVHEIYKRTHGAAPARLLAAHGLGRTLRGRCRRCSAALDPDAIPSVPFAHFGVIAAARHPVLPERGLARGARESESKGSDPSTRGRAFGATPRSGRTEMSDLPARLRSATGLEYRRVPWLRGA